MRQMNLTNVLLILFVSAISFAATCQRVPIYDHELCGDKGKLGAKCFHLLTDEIRAIQKEAWDDERFGQVCMKADAYANFKAALMKLCSAGRGCTWEDAQNIRNLGKRIKAFSAEALEAKALQ